MPGSRNRSRLCGRRVTLVSASAPPDVLHSFQIGSEMGWSGQALIGDSRCARARKATRGGFGERIFTSMVKGARSPFVAFTTADLWPGLS